MTHFINVHAMCKVVLFWSEGVILDRSFLVLLVIHGDGTLITPMRFHRLNHLPRLFIFCHCCYRYVWNVVITMEFCSCFSI